MWRSPLAERLKGAVVSSSSATDKLDKDRELRPQCSHLLGSLGGASTADRRGAAVNRQLQKLLFTERTHH